jgi:hypothetical protein
MAEFESGSVIVGIFGDAGGRDPGARSGKRGAVHAGDTDKDDGAKAGRGHLQLAMNFGVTFGAEGKRCGCGGNGIGARNARGNRGDWAGGARGWQDQSANIDAQAAVIRESCECMLNHPRPPLGTPARAMPGFDPAMGEKKESSPAKMLMANIAVTRQVRTTAESDLFMMGILIC